MKSFLERLINFWVGQFYCVGEVTANRKLFMVGLGPSNKQYFFITNVQILLLTRYPFHDHKTMQDLDTATTGIGIILSRQPTTKALNVQEQRIKPETFGLEGKHVQNCATFLKQTGEV